MSVATRGLVMMLAAMALLTGCGGGADADSNAAPSDSRVAEALGPTDDAWTKQLDSTTCQEWTAVMTAAQRAEAAARMLRVGRQTDGLLAPASPDLVARYAGGVSNACVIETMTVSEVGYGVYTTERAEFAR